MLSNVKCTENAMLVFFLSGALFPLKNLPNRLSFLTKIDPVTYGVAPLRETVLSSQDLPTFVLNQLGVNVTIFGYTLTAAAELAIVAVLELVFVTWAAVMFSRQD
jgi:ABC-2 type transport system permease protein